MRMLIAQDLRHAARLFRREPGYTAIAALAIALAIAATTTIASVTYGVLLKPLPWPEPERLLRLEERRGGRSGRVPWTMTMDDRLMSSLSRPRAYAVVLGGLAMFALAIAMVGLFGVLSYTVAQRSREIGVTCSLSYSANC